MRFILSLALALSAFAAGRIHAQDCGCCPHCGCNNLTKVCRIVPVVTKVSKVEYSCKCGDICVPGHSQCVGTESVTDCDGNCHQQKVYQPTCGKIFKTVTPQKTTTTVEKCGYKCVVEYVCGKCGCGCGNGGGKDGGTYGQAGSVPQMAEAANQGPPLNSYWLK